VAKMIVSSTTTSSRLHLIDALERLCLDHLFEQEISATLAQIETADVTDWDLGTVALWFCLLRKHRYTVSPGSSEYTSACSLISIYNIPRQQFFSRFELMSIVISSFHSRISRPSYTFLPK